jgi:Holliday junction DNA helicase RuvA
MYNYFKGTVAEINEEYIVVECGGVGYEIYATADCKSNITLGKEAKVYVYHSVSAQDGTVTLCGFLSKDEKELFLLLKEVDGIGPKTAIGILSNSSVIAIKTAITTGNVKGLSAIKGIGKKKAEKIIVELKDKLGAPDSADAFLSQPAQSVADDEKGLNKDAIEALMSFGLNKQEAINRVRAVQKDGMTLQQIIFKGLQQG